MRPDCGRVGPCRDGDRPVDCRPDIRTAMKPNCGLPTVAVSAPDPAVGRTGVGGGDPRGGSRDAARAFSGRAAAADRSRSRSAHQVGLHPPVRSDGARWETTSSSHSTTPRPETHGGHQNQHSRPGCLRVPAAASDNAASASSRASSLKCRSTKSRKRLERPTRRVD